jgi:hypothetical protein
MGCFLGGGGSFFIFFGSCALFSEDGDGYKNAGQDNEQYDGRNGLAGHEWSSFQKLYLES